MDRKLSVALVGCGRAARHLHIPVLTGLDRVELTAIAEADPERRGEAAATLPGARTFGSYEELLEQGDVEAAVIALPNHLHAHAAVAAFECGLHVYLEKPIAVDLGDADRVVEAWHAAGTVGMIGLNYRFSPLYEQARRLMAEGRIGRIVTLRTVFSRAPGELPGWKRHRETGGGALLDLASHHLDLAVWMVGAPPRAISCSLHSMKSDDDTALVDMELQGGIRCQAMASLTAVEDDRMEVYGDEGRIVIDGLRADRIGVHPASLHRVRTLQLVHAVRAFTSPRFWHAKLRPGRPPASYYSALGEFAAAALEGRSPSPDLADGRRGLAILDAARRSAREGRTVYLDEAAHAHPAGQ